jgi:putative ABC transport system substrate-binding protein
LRIAVIAPGVPGCAASPPGMAFVQGLRDLGYEPLPQVDTACVPNPADAQAVVSDVLGRRPRLVVVWAYVAVARLVHDAAPDMPIVIVDVANPVGNGLIKSLSRPGGRVTGIANSTEELQAKRVQILREALPQSTRLAILCNPDNPLQREYIGTTNAAAVAVRWEAKTYPVRTRSELVGAFAQMERDRTDALILVPDPWFYASRRDIVELARRHHLPAIYNNASYPELGGLFTYTSDFTAMGYRAAHYANKILRGVPPADLPVELPTTFEFVINLSAARELGLKVPPSLMQRATRVIE